jgi:hypothetical protein
MSEIPQRCAGFDEELSALIDSELAPEREAELRVHLEGCERCARRLRALHRVDALLAQTPLPAVPAQLAEGIASRLAPRRAAPGLRRRWPWVGAALAAASAAALYLALPARRTPPAGQEPLLAQEVPAPEPARERPAAGASPEPRAVARAAPPGPAPEGAPRAVARAQPPAAPEAAELEAASDEELALALEIETLEDFDLIANLELAMRLAALEGDRG